MILSEKNKFIFIKGLKVAGTSIEILLSEICGPNDIITPLAPVDERSRLLTGKNAAQNYGDTKEKAYHFLTSLKNSQMKDIGNFKRPQTEYYNHMPLTEVVDLYGEVSNDWLIFGIERCPYRKIISFANWRLKIKEYHQTGNPIINDIKTVKKYLDNIISNELILNVKNIDRYKNKEGLVCAEFLRFEKIHDDVDKLMRKLNIQDYPKLEHYKKGISSNNLDLPDIFTKTQISKINELFEEEFNHYGYSMI